MARYELMEVSVQPRDSDLLTVTLVIRASELRSGTFSPLELAPMGFKKFVRTLLVRSALGFLARTNKLWTGYIEADRLEPSWRIFLWRRGP